MTCYIDRAAKAAGFHTQVWWTRKRQPLINEMIGRYEAVAMGFEVPPPLLLTERFNHGQSIAAAHRIAQVVAIIQRADALARREHGTADTDSTGGEADRG